MQVLSRRYRHAHAVETELRAKLHKATRALEEARTPDRLEQVSTTDSMGLGADVCSLFGVRGGCVLVFVLLTVCLYTMQVLDRTRDVVASHFSSLCLSGRPMGGVPCRSIHL